MCYISIINMQGDDSDDDDFSGGMSFSSRGSGASGGFEKIGVKKDTETGEITGWEAFYAMARDDNPELV